MPFAYKSMFWALLAWTALVAQAVAIPERRAVSRTSSPKGCLAVRGNAPLPGEFASLQAAVNSIGSSNNPACIFIYPGVYQESVDIKIRAPLTLYGSTVDTKDYKHNAVTFTHNLGSYDAGSLDASSTVNVRSSNFSAYNINFANTYTAGQAVALTANGNMTGFYGCSFKSYQDTLYAKNGWQYYSNCYIEGAVDYIFGNGHAWFGECTIASSGPGYITASSRTYDNDTSRYVIDHSTITSAADADDLTGKVYLGRPWRVNARVMYQTSTLTGVVRPEGWAPMAEGATPVFQEYGNTGAGADTSARKFFTAADKAVQKRDLWGSAYQWYDTSF
ncbi:pectin lyase fold/virulence factor [Parachaetomium inaequale]|uniref:Pectinesterase n=1 Tax=Parachaetomium inaequale TaxID=2588326 RepID=A0AAN6PNF5_9PEZI|nr:pectin lyase fold/virulence factor [Parachaetomium inaequale]